jgi:hypothetical protein
MPFEPDNDAEDIHGKIRQLKDRRLCGSGIAGRSPQPAGISVRSIGPQHAEMLDENVGRATLPLASRGEFSSDADDEPVTLKNSSLYKSWIMFSIK